MAISELFYNEGTEGALINAGRVLDSPDSNGQEKDNQIHKKKKLLLLFLVLKINVWL